MRFFVFLAAASIARAQATVHPLDPLGRAEILTVGETLRAAGKLTDARRFVTITLHEPEKRDALADVAAGRTRRAADVVLYDWATRVTSEATIDLARRSVTAWRDLPAGEPPVRAAIIARMDEIVRADPRWAASMRRRGFTDLSRISVLGGVNGEGQPLSTSGSDRIANAFLFLNDSGPGAETVDGLGVRMNLTKGTVTAFDDAPPPPRPKRAATTAAATASLAPLHITQPAGSSATVRGSEVRWERWRLHVGVHPRRGLELYDVAFEDGGRWRPVLYRASISEVVAPYGDPSFGTWYPRDEGDYGMMNYNRTQLIPGADVPEYATFIPAAGFDGRGTPVDLPRAAAVYERDGGLLWRHGNRSRRGRQLVVASVATVDNYDYAFNWIFGQDGSLEVQLQLTGIMNTNRTPKQRDTTHIATAHESFGHLVAPGVNAPNHQHFFSYRLDMDVDGADANTVLELETQAIPRGERNQQGEWFTMRERPLTTERQAQRSLDLARNRRWKIASTRALNSLGQATGFVIAPGENSVPYVASSSAVNRKVGFIGSHLWVTPYRRDEMHASGEYPNLHTAGDGLPKWTSADRPIASTDVVVWYTLGVTHIPRPEDFPLMPTHTAGFRLVPAGFFSQNPALDAPTARVAANGRR
jgi:primary-amine oxidase